MNKKQLGPYSRTRIMDNQAIIIYEWDAALGRLVYIQCPVCMEYQSSVLQCVVQMDCQSCKIKLVLYPQEDTQMKRRKMTEFEKARDEKTGDLLEEWMTGYDGETKVGKLLKLLPKMANWSRQWTLKNLQGGK